MSDKQNPPRFHPGSTVWYISGKKIRQGTIVTGEVIIHAIEARVEVRTVDPRYKGQVLKLIRLVWIMRGEEIRCRQEIARCEAQIATDEGALIGAADWKRELELLQGTAMKHQHPQKIGKSPYDAEMSSDEKATDKMNLLDVPEISR